MSGHTEPVAAQRAAPIKALSMRQPWAWLVVMGYKIIETRSRGTSHRGPLLIHACGKFGKAENNQFQKILNSDVGVSFGPESETDKLVAYTGGIIGSVSLKDVTHTFFDPRATERLEILYAKYHLCVPIDDYEWEGKKGWWLENPVMFDKPIPCKGTIFPLLWTPPDGVLAQVREVAP